jgi:hypothetical protein
MADAATTRAMHRTIYNFWRTQIEKATECQKRACLRQGHADMWARRIENADEGLRKFNESVTRKYGSDYMLDVTMPEWHEFLDLLC